MEEPCSWYPLSGVLSKGMIKLQIYNALKNVVVIIITPNDPFGHDLMMYTVKNSIKELPHTEYEDGAVRCFCIRMEKSAMYMRSLNSCFITWSIQQKKTQRQTR